MINTKLAENSNIPRIRTKEGLLHYAVHIEKKYEELLNQYHQLDRQLRLQKVGKSQRYSKAVKINAALLKKLQKARFRIQEAKKYNDQAVNQTAYWLFIAGVSWAINNLEEDNSVRLDNRAKEIENIINKKEV
jgi:hypothetical protein